MRLNFHVYGNNPDEINDRARHVIDCFLGTTNWHYDDLNIWCRPHVETTDAVVNWTADIDATITPTAVEEFLA